MNDYISRDDVLKAIDYQHEVNNVFESEAAYVQMWETINDDRGIKAADVQPVKHGRWLSHHAIWIDQPKIEGWFVQAKCSECEKWAHVMNPYTKSVDYECCPHCGARMIKDGDTD